MTAFLLGCVMLTLLLPVSNGSRILAVVLQGLLQGLSGSVSLVFMVHCLRRGTTPEGRALALKKTYTAGPVTAVAGSLGAQYLLGSGRLSYPLDFALIYAVGALCVVGVAVSSTRFVLPPVDEEPRTGLVPYLTAGAKQFFDDRQLRRLWVSVRALVVHSREASRICRCSLVRPSDAILKNYPGLYWPFDSDAKPSADISSA